MSALFSTGPGLPFGVTGRDTPAVPVAPGVVTLTADAPWYSERIFGAVPGASPEPAGLPSSSSPDALPFGVAPGGTIPVGPEAAAPSPALREFLPDDWRPGDGIPQDLAGVAASDVPVEFVRAPSVSSPEFSAQLSGSVVNPGSTTSGAGFDSGGGYVPPEYPKSKPGTFPSWMVWTLLGVGLLAAWRFR